jgi:G:T-mismatch repair DNA endonuclease (very short patch repair protein)
VLVINTNIDMNKICPFCEKKITPSDGNHIYRCNYNILCCNKTDIKFQYLKHNFPEISGASTLETEYVKNKLSLVGIRNKYGIDYKSTQWLLNYHNIKHRTSSESCLIGSSRAKETLRKLYGEGISSPSQLETVKEKKRKTFIKKYGVDNIRKWKPFYEYIKSVIESKYNTDYAKFVSNNSKKVWDSKTDDEKNKWLNDSIHSDSAKTKSLSNRNGFIVSKIEDVVSKILSELNIIHTRQYILKYNGIRKFYDFYLPDYDVIIEVNGDYWHASPTIYHKNDLINYPFGYKTAKEIWEKDLIKKQHAEKRNIPILYIWEYELKKNKNDLINLIKNRLYELCENKIN